MVTWLFPAYAEVIVRRKACGLHRAFFPAYAGLILCIWLTASVRWPFPRIRGAYQKTPRKVLRERLKKVPIKQTNRPGFRDGSRGGFVCRRRG